MTLPSSRLPILTQSPMLSGRDRAMAMPANISPSVVCADKPIIKAKAPDSAANAVIDLSKTNCRMVSSAKR